MKTPSLLVLILSLTLFGAGLLACQGSRPGIAAATAPPPPPPPPAAPELVRYERTACMGPCPVDVLTLFADGRLRYEGRLHGPRTGVYSGQLSPAELLALNQQFAQAPFFDLAPVYTSRALDLPTRHLRYSAGGRSHQVKDYDGAPASLKSLEASLEQLIRADRWQPSQ